eukprot:1137796-Pelagomonas_calceolata.AAC.1
MEDAPRLLEFLGCMLGKAMYEGILLELPLARESRRALLLSHDVLSHDAGLLTADSVVAVSGFSGVMNVSSAVVMSLAPKHTRPHSRHCCQWRQWRRDR